MPKCSHIDPLVTPYVDGELSATDREMITAHLDRCAPCRGRVLAEQAVRTVLSSHRGTLAKADRAQAALRARCASLASTAATFRVEETRVRAGASTSARSSWRARLAPLALAATLVLVVAAAFLYQITSSSTRVMAAELTADHVKCFALNAVLGTHQSAEVVQSSMASGFDWRVQLPDTESAGLSLVGSRPCLYGEGRVAHIMFRHNGTPVSLFMLPKSARSDEVVRVLGHEAAVWSVGDRTFVLIADETPAEVERMATFIQTSLH